MRHLGFARAADVLERNAVCLFGTDEFSRAVVLQLKHVVPVEVGHAQIQRAVAQVVGGVHQGRPHLLGHLVGHRQRNRGAECSQSLGRGIVEGARDGIFGKVPEVLAEAVAIMEGAGSVEYARTYAEELSQNASGPSCGWPW